MLKDLEIGDTFVVLEAATIDSMYLKETFVKVKEMQKGEEFILPNDKIYTFRFFSTNAISLGNVKEYAFPLNTKVRKL